MPQPRKQSEEHEPMITTRLSLTPHTAAKLLQKRYKAEGDKPTLSDALWRFIQEKDPTLAQEAEQTAALRSKLADLLGDEDD